MWTKKFWTDLAERAIATAVEVAVPMIVAAETLDAVDYKHVAWVVGTAAVLSVLKGMGAKLKGNRESASLADS